MKNKKKTLDGVAVVRKRHEELSRAYADLSDEQIDERVQQALKDDPLWRRHNRPQVPSPSKWLSLVPSGGITILVRREASDEGWKEKQWQIGFRKRNSRRQSTGS